MSETLNSPDCCGDTCCDPVTTVVPGPPGANGAAGAAGSNGVNSFTTLTAGFVMPAEGADVQITVGTTAWMVARQGAIQGQIIYIGFAGHFEVRSVDSSVLATVRNLEDTAASLYVFNAAPGVNIPSAARVSPAGLQGPDGTAPADALLAANNLNDVDDVSVSRGNLGLGTAAVLDQGNSNGDLPMVNDAGGLVNGESVFATATGLETKDAGQTRTAIGLGTMAVQNAGAVAITGGSLNGTLGATTPSTAQVTNITASGISTFGGNTIISAPLFTPAVGATQSLLAATAINPVGVKIKVVGNGGAVVLVATPTISAPATDGQILLIQGTDGTNTVELQDDGSLAGSGLELGAASRVLGLGDTILLTWDSTTSKWYEVSFSNN